MTLGEKISQLRKERNLTQAELGNELGVTYQAVSKWERDDSMPDFDMISKLAKLFGVSISYFENGSELCEQDEEDSVQDDEYGGQGVAAADSQILGVCTVCGKYINKDTVGEESPKLICIDCCEARQEQAERDERALIEKERRDRSALSWQFTKRSIIASVVAGIISILFLVGGIISKDELLHDFATGEFVGLLIAVFVTIFTWVFQLFFYGAVRSVTLAGMFFIRLPGIIFSADLDGLIFLIAMKILFFIISAVVFIGAMVVTSIAAMVVSLFTFIPVIFKIIRRNEDIL